MSRPKIAFIGGGNMATSLISGILDEGYPSSHITVSGPTEEKLFRLNQKFGINTTTDNSIAAAGAEIILLSVKPKMVKPVSLELSAFLKHRPLVISVAAGIPLLSLQKWLGTGVPVIRCMPNTPALVQTGATGLFADTDVSSEQCALATEIFNAVGVCCWLEKEEDLDVVTAVSGSAPAYFFLFMEAMEKTAIELGLSQEVARKLILQTALGAAKMAIENGAEPAELRRRVTSPAGTTEAAINTFLEGDILGLFDKAMASCVRRAKELAQEA
ncbi:MAG: pyrroline-5-carboxylate reductase [Porticoccus sp.]